MGTTIKVDQIIGRDLFALKQVTVLSSLFEQKYTVAVGQRVGKVYSYLERNGQIYWQFENGDMVLHSTGAFDLKSIIDQGGKTSEQLTREKELENKPWFEKAFGKVSDMFSIQTSAFKVGLTSLIVLIVIVAAIKIIQVSKINIKTLTA
jgi:hypothetical protein